MDEREHDCDEHEPVGPVVWAGLKDAVESAQKPADTDIDIDVDKLEGVAKKAAVSAVLATSLSSVLSEPPRTDLVTLPQPTPIVRMLDDFDEDDTPEDKQDEEDGPTSTWRDALLRILRMLALAILVALILGFAALKGCASCAARTALPPAQEQEDEAQDEAADDEEDTQTTERGAWG